MTAATASTNGVRYAGTYRRPKKGQVIEGPTGPEQILRVLDRHGEALEVRDRIGRVDERRRAPGGRWTVIECAVVRIENTYSCGRESEHLATVSAVPFGAQVGSESLEDWFGETVHEHTGDGHPCGSSDYAVYEAEILIASDRPDLVGHTYEWGG
jgi:hypothetical protein